MLDLVGKSFEGFLGNPVGCDAKLGTAVHEPREVHAVGPFGQKLVERMSVLCQKQALPSRTGPSTLAN
jgi:hypothetical protein